MKLNIQDNKKEVFIKSIMWNSIIEVFISEKNIRCETNLILEIVDKTLHIHKKLI